MYCGHVFQTGFRSVLKIVFQSICHMCIDQFYYYKFRGVLHQNESLAGGSVGGRLPLPMTTLVMNNASHSKRDKLKFTSESGLHPSTLCRFRWWMATLTTAHAKLKNQNSLLAVNPRQRFRPPFSHSF